MLYKYTIPQQHILLQDSIKTMSILLHKVKMKFILQPIFHSNETDLIKFHHMIKMLSYVKRKSKLISLWQTRTVKFRTTRCFKQHHRTEKVLADQSFEMYIWGQKSYVVYKKHILADLALYKYNTQIYYVRRFPAYIRMKTAKKMHLTHEQKSLTQPF